MVLFYLNLIKTSKNAKNGSCLVCCISNGKSVLFLNRNKFLYKNVFEIYDNYCDAAALYLIYGPI